MLVETYGEATLNKRSCEWFQNFKNHEFAIEDKERSGRSKVYEDAELETLLNQDSCQINFLLFLPQLNTPDSSTPFKVVS